MKMQVCGFDGPLARATRSELVKRGHAISEAGAECAIYFPGTLAELEKLASSGVRRLVLRSHASAYGASTKNPGLMTEDRVSLLPAQAPEQRWLQAEAAAARHPNWAAVRLTNVLAREEGDLLVRQLSSRIGVSVAGRDPVVQFIGVVDAARALAAAAESQSVGLFNAAGEGTIPLKKAFRASGAWRLPLPGLLAKPLAKGDSVEELQYNWTISSARAARELGFRPEDSTPAALAAFLSNRPGARPGTLERRYDPWGLDVDYIRAWGWWFRFLRNVYWRIEHEGLENIPQRGRALYVSNHRGFMPLDAVMHLSLSLTHRQRIPRFLIIHILLRQPFLCNFLTKLGGVLATRENAAMLLADENLVAIFPEGIRGAFTPYRKAYRLHDFAKRSGFAEIAIENQAPVIPAAVVGNAEIFPIIGRIDSSYAVKELGWPYFPIAPMFPLAPVPIPSKWHVRVLPAVPLEGLKPRDAENKKLVSEFSWHIQHILQRNIDDMVKRRKGIFRGRIFDGTAPASPPFVPPEGRVQAAS